MSVDEYNRLRHCTAEEFKKSSTAKGCCYKKTCSKYVYGEYVS